MKTVELSVENSLSKVILTGDLGIENALEIKDALLESLKHEGVTIDLERVDSASISTFQLIQACRLQAKSMNKPFSIYQPVSHAMMETAREYGLVDVLL